MIAASVRLYHPKKPNRWLDESPINLWLLANVGRHSEFKNAVDELRPWSVEHHRDYLVYNFAREQDAVMFALKWS